MTQRSVGASEPLARVIDPRGLALRFMRHDGLLGAGDADDVLSDAMYGIAKGVASWDPDAGLALTTWCWWKMRSEVSHGREHRARFTAERPTDWTTPADWHPDLTDPGYKQAEDRVLLQRWADMARLTDLQADLVAWFAVHDGTPVRRAHPKGTHAPTTSKRPVVDSALARLRRVAVTGRPFVRTVPAPTYSLADVRAAVTG